MLWEFLKGQLLHLINQKLSRYQMHSVSQLEKVKKKTEEKEKKKMKMKKADEKDKKK